MIFGDPHLAVAAAIVLMSNTVLQSPFEFGNGSSVQIENPLHIKEFSLTLRDPEFLGAGGSGAVFSYRETHRRQQQVQKNDPTASNNHIRKYPDKKVAVKYSWLQSAESVRNECHVLSVLEQRHVTGVQRCLAQIPYREDARRVIIITEPVVDDAVSSMSDLSSSAARTATQMLMRAMAQMLAARVVTTDVQPLISKSTGELLLIDMTEATILPSSDEVLSDLNIALVTEFCNEVINLLPSTMLEMASHAFYEEVSRIEASSSTRLDDQMKTIIDDLLAIE
jgi:hypothetical protein